MSRLIPFNQCKARPDVDGEVYYLIDHLEGVRDYAYSFFQNNRNNVDGELLLFCALSHDIGKAHNEWQLYVSGKKERGPNHSSCGAIFFSYLSYHWLCLQNEWNVENQWLWLGLIRDIADHHGALKGFSKNTEIERAAAFDQMDMLGIQNWLYSLYPILRERHIPFSKEILNEWKNDGFEDLLEDAIFNVLESQELSQLNIKNKMTILQHYRKLTASLISADRMDIQSIKDVRIARNEWLEVDRNISHFCKKGDQHPLSKIRTNAQQSIIKQWRENSDKSMFVLEMPTGYGKTLTSLRLASEIGKERGHSKIIYVAPYLSVLSQNAHELEKAMKRTPLEHHSMAIIDKKVISENISSDENVDLIVQSWANHVVCTTFVQWMKALFPHRAQETLRRVFLEDSVVIIDEPQIIDASVWNLFLMGLEAVKDIYNLVVIFVSATMPPFKYGLSIEPKRLYVESKKENNRYSIHLIEPLVANECAMKLSSTDVPSGAAILNTIQDALDVYQALPKGDMENYLLHGLMVPIHKEIQLKKIHRALNDSQNKIRIVSTQVLEAGANVSFHYLFRALPIIPSLAQAAGRVNRHQELGKGLIETGVFFREDSKKDSRLFIYDSSLCRITDELIQQKDVWLESEIAPLVQQFYKQMFVENEYKAILQDINRAFDGHWESLSKHEVFKSTESQRLPIFIPFVWHEDAKLLPTAFLQLLDEFEITNPRQIHDLFLDKKFRVKWNFSKNKRFMILFNQFVLNIPLKKALNFVSKEAFLNDRIPILEDDFQYCHEKGLHFITEDIENSFI